MKKIKENELRTGLRLKTNSTDQEVPDIFKVLDIISIGGDGHVTVQSVSHPHQQGIWWNKFIVNRGYYKLEEGQ